MSDDVRGSRNTRGRYSTNTARWHRTCTRAAVRAYLFEAACLSTCVLIGEYAFWNVGNRSSDRRPRERSFWAKGFPSTVGTQGVGRGCASQQKSQ